MNTFIETVTIVMQSVVLLVAINIRAVIPFHRVTLVQNFELHTLALMTSCFYMKCL